MTKYVLNSGGIKRYPVLKKQFHQELVKDLGDNPKVLACNFAQPREVWNRKFDSYCKAIIEDMPDSIVPSFDLAMPDTFEEQCARADIIYFHGGDDNLIQYWMKKYDLITLFEDKVIATNSASSDMLAAHYWGSDWRQCGDGLNILPIKFIPHYLSTVDDIDPRGPIDWQKAYDDLAAYGDTNLPIHALKEGEFVVIEQSEKTEE